MACAACTKPVNSGMVEIAPIDSLYTLKAPAYLKAGYDMHDFAGLQYYDMQQGVFLLGVEDNKANLGNVKRRTLRLEDYYTFVETHVLEQADSTFKEATQSFTLEGDVKALCSDYYATGWHEGDRFELFYRVAVYNTPEHFIQLVVWMPYAEACDRYEMTEEVLRSLRLAAPKSSDGVAGSP